MISNLYLPPNINNLPFLIEKNALYNIILPRIHSSLNS